MTDGHVAAGQPPAAHRSRTDVVAFVATAVSAVALVATVVGRIVGAHGFSSSDDDTSTLSSVCLAVFVLGLLIALIMGAASWWTARRTGRASGVAAARIAAGYLVVAVVTAAVLNFV